MRKTMGRLTHHFKKKSQAKCRDEPLTKRCLLCELVQYYYVDISLINVMKRNILEVNSISSSVIFFIFIHCEIYARIHSTNRAVKNIQVLINKYIGHRHRFIQSSFLIMIIVIGRHGSRQRLQPAKISYSDRQTTRCSPLYRVLYGLALSQVINNLIYAMLSTWFNLPHGSACEKNNSFQLLVIEEVIKGPEAPRFPKGVACQVRVVAVNAAFGQQDLLFDGGPQGRTQLTPACAAHGRECTVQGSLHPTQRWLSTEFTAL